MGKYNPDYMQSLWNQLEHVGMCISIVCAIVKFKVKFVLWMHIIYTRQ